MGNKARPADCAYIRRKSDGKLAVVSKDKAKLLSDVGTWVTISRNKFKKGLKALKKQPVRMKFKTLREIKNHCRGSK